MKIMENSVRFMRLSRILRDGKEPVWVAILKWTVCTFFLVQFIVPQVLFIFTRAKNVIEIATITFQILAIFGKSVQFSLLSRNASFLKEYVHKLEDLVNRKIAENDTGNFQRTERIIATISGIVIKLGIAVTVLYVFRPGVIQAYAVINGSVTNETFVGTFNDVYYLFDSSKSPMYELCYLSTTVGLCIALTALLTVELSFFAVTMYTVALYDELEHMVRESCSMQPHQPVWRRRHKLIECVEFHNELLGIIKSGQTLFSGVILVQLSYGTISLVTNVFALSFSTTVAEAFIYTVDFALISSELLIFCWTGSMVLRKADDLRVTLYSKKWYDFSQSDKRILYMFVMRTFRLDGYSAYQVVYCNTDTFVQISRNVLSVFAFLKTMV